MTGSHSFASTITAVIICTTLSSCATLRMQTVRGPGPVWLSTTGDDASLNKLTVLNKKKTTPDAIFVSVDRGVRVFVSEWTKKRCRGTSFFIKVQIQDGASKGLEGWMCESAITHHQVGAL
jgi:hypothetical protein